MMLTSTQIGELAAQFFIAGAGTLSFAVLFGCPRKSLPFCGLVGAVGWLVYELAVMLDAELKYYQKDYAGAVKSLNLIAKRAYGVDDFYTEATKEAVLDALCTETLLEFPCEGVVWWTLIRLDKIWDYNPSLAERRALNPNILLWPISASARNKNTKLRQTEGWN